MDREFAELTIHCTVKDGSVFHVPFSRETWEVALADDDLESRHAHREDECSDDPILHRLRQLVDSGELAPNDRQLAMLDGVQRAEPQPCTSTVVEPVSSVGWPPEVELQPWMLAEMAGISKDEAVAMLAAPRVKQTFTLPLDERGQFSLF